MDKLAAGALAALTFGLVALVGLIVLAGTGHLTGTVEGTLEAVAFGALTAITGIHVAGSVAGAVTTANMTASPAGPVVVDDTPPLAAVDAANLSAGNVEPSDPTPADLTPAAS